MLRHALNTGLALVVASTMAAAAQTQHAAPPTSPSPSHVHHGRRVIHGTLEKLDAAGKTITVKTADGAQAVLHFTDYTVINGLAGGAKATALAGKEGGHVVVHYTEHDSRRAAKAAEKGAKEVEGKTVDVVTYVGSSAVNVLEGTVDTIDRTAKTVVITTGTGGHETLHLAAHATIDTERSAKRVAVTSGHALDKGAHVIAYYTTDAGRKIAHAFDRTDRESRHRKPAMS